jgi:hypothetical protein
MLISLALQRSRPTPFRADNKRPKVAQTGGRGI